MRRTRIKALIFCMAVMLPLDVIAAPPELDQAAQFLEAKNYTAAGNLARAYLSNHPRRYRADYILAVSECKTSRGLPDAQRRIRAVKADYSLDSVRAKEVDRWIAACIPPPQPPPAGLAANDVGSTSSSLTVTPSVASASSTISEEPVLRPQMGALVLATSYSGDDYAHPSANSAQDCVRLCFFQAPCRSMTYDETTKICWLKRSIPPARHGSGFTSAVKLVPAG